MSTKKPFQPGIIFGGVHSDVASVHGGYSTSYGIRLLLPQETLSTTKKVGIIIDNGTGIVNVIRDFDQYIFDHVIVLQTHYHMDHIAGIHYNSYIQYGRCGHLIGPNCLFRRKNYSIYHCLGDFFFSNIWPAPEPLIVETDAFSLSSNKSIWTYAGKILTIPLPHPGECAGYRIKTPCGDVVIATDCELAKKEDQIRFAEFIEGAKHIILDMQYTDEEYIGHVDWGHNCPRLVIETLERVKDLKGANIYFVHRPNGADDTVENSHRLLLSIAEALKEKEMDSYTIPEDNQDVNF